MYFSRIINLHLTLAVVNLELLCVQLLLVRQMEIVL